RTGQINVGQPSAVGISGAVTKATCYGSATGAITITINNGVAPFTYAWSDGATTEDRSNITAGTYTLLVTDSNGCTREKSFNVTQPTALTLSFNVSNASCNGALDGEITANANGGTKFPTTSLCNGERYCFDWSHGDNARVTSGIGAGTYTVTVTDANGCNIIGSATVTEPTALEITHVQVDPLPNGKFKVTVTATGGTPAYKYKRIPGGGFQGSNVFNNVPSGTYEIVVRDKNICETSTTITVGSAGRPGDSGDRQELDQVLKVDTDDPLMAYPNPASERFQVQVDREYQTAHLMIFNAQGQLMEEKSFEGNADLGTYEVYTWKPGLYFVIVELDGERLVKKLIVASK
ncbi:MAG: T9SS type A sorting domain-containing protein, partial [Phycisphaerae bacterium]|nr:T9SS type A sorting domain-containing protein [Saprospiraceae bacterium]